MVFQQTSSTIEEIAPIIVVIAVKSGDGWEKEGFGCRKSTFLWLSEAVNRDLLSLRTQVPPEHSFARSPVSAPASTRNVEQRNEIERAIDRAGDIERAGDIDRAGEQLFYELKRLTLNAPIYVVPIDDLPLLRCEPPLLCEPQLLCIVAHETIRSTLDTSTLPIPHMLIEYNDAGELRFVTFVTKRKERRTRKRRKRERKGAR